MKLTIVKKSLIILFTIITPLVSFCQTELKPNELHRVSELTNDDYPVTFRIANQKYYILKEYHANLWAKDIQRLKLIQAELETYVEQDSIDSYAKKVREAQLDDLLKANTDIKNEMVLKYDESLDLYKSNTISIQQLANNYVGIEDVLEENKRLKIFRNTTIAVLGSGVVATILSIVL